MSSFGPIWRFDIVGPHFCSLTHLYHDKLVNLRVFLSIITHIRLNFVELEMILPLCFDFMIDMDRIG